MKQTPSFPELLFYRTSFVQRAVFLLLLEKFLLRNLCGSYYHLTKVDLVFNEVFLLTWMDVRHNIYERM